MTSHSVGAAVAAGALVLLLGSSCSSGTETAAPTTSDPTRATVAGSLRIDGAVGAPRQLTLTDLRNFPPQSRAVTFDSSGGSQSHTFVGASMTDVLSSAQPTTDPTVKNPSLRLVVVATGADGYKAALSWGEFDPGFGATPVVIAYQEDGTDLSAPRLVVPGDVKGGRYVSDLTSITVLDTGTSN